LGAQCAPIAMCEIATLTLRVTPNRTYIL